MNTKITICFAITFLLSLMILASENHVLAQNDGVPEITIKAVSELGGLYGEPTPLFDAKDIYGNNFDMRSLQGKTILLEFLTSETFYKNPALWKYSNVLAQRYKDNNFISVLVLNDKKVKLSKLKRTLAESNIELPIFLTQSEKINDLFGLESGSMALVLIDSTSVVRFAKPKLLANDTKRQLVEKLVVGSIEYSFEREDSLGYTFKLSKKMPDLNLEGIGAEKKLMLSELYQKPMICFLFTTGCSRCEITKFLNALVKIEKSLKGEVASENMLIIFREDISEKELEKFLKDYNIDIPAYQTADLQNLTSEYVTRKTESMRPKVIFLDEFGAIRYLKNLSDFRIELENKSVDFQALQKGRKDE